MINPKTAIDDTITGRCTKCRKNTSHRVVSTIGDAADKVECSQCGRQHKYRPATATKTSPAQLRQRKLQAEHKEWENIRGEMDGSKAVPYAMSGTYRVNSVIQHSRFGLGLVQRSIGSTKMEVLFESGKKILCCRYS